MDESVVVAMEALDDLLDAERDALLRGALDDVSRLIGRKEALIGALSRGGVQNKAGFEALQDKVGRNQILLDSALDGVRSVSKRLEAIRRVSRSLDTYGSDGQKRTVTLKSGSKLEKRA